MRITTSLLGVLLLAWTLHGSAEEQPQRSPRLKFRDGPPCMCHTGLDEKAIRDAEETYPWKRLDEPRQPATTSTNQPKGD